MYFLLVKPLDNICKLLWRMLPICRLLDFSQVLVIADNVSVSFQELPIGRFSEHFQVPEIINYSNLI